MNAQEQSLGEVEPVLDLFPIQHNCEYIKMDGHIKWNKLYMYTKFFTSSNSLYLGLVILDASFALAYILFFLRLITRARSVPTTNSIITKTNAPTKHPTIM